MRLLGELHSLTTADGLIRVFDGQPAVRVFGGYGAPPTRFVTQRLFEQAGAIERDYRLDTRAVILELVQGPPDSRAKYWDNRAALHDLLRPNRGGPLTLTLRLPDGSKRTLAVRADPGLQFPPEGDNSWLVRETLTLLAHDPLWTDPAASAYNALASTDDQLTFPTHFRSADRLVRFGNDNLIISTGPIVYTGTWRTYPIVTLTGPYSSARLQNLVTGATILLVKTVNTLEQRVIDLTPGALTVTDAAGTNRFGDVDPGSNFVDFAILPDPESLLGNNELQVTLIDGGATSAIAISFNARYFGV